MSETPAYPIADPDVGMTAASGLSVRTIKTTSGHKVDGSIWAPCNDRLEGRQPWWLAEVEERRERVEVVLGSNGRVQSSAYFLGCAVRTAAKQTPITQDV